MASSAPLPWRPKSSVRDDRLVVRELLAGSSRFNDLRRGVPLMSPTLLSKRLKELEEAA